MNDHDWKAPAGRCAACGIGPLCQAAFKPCPKAAKPACRHCGGPLMWDANDSGYPAEPAEADGWWCPKCETFDV